MINFVFMLTHSDSTIPGAIEYVEPVAATGLRYIGFKDVGTDPETQAQIAKAARNAGLETMLEVVSTSRADEVRSVQAAVAAGVDWVLGGTNPDAALPLLVGTDIKYCPFPGRVVGHPSVLEGEIDQIAASAGELTSTPGVHGLDLLAYRHATADVPALTRAVVDASHGPVIAAGSITTAGQIHDLAAAGAWGFTIGSAIFDRLLPGAPDVVGQVREVLTIAAST